MARLASIVVVLLIAGTWGQTAAQNVRPQGGAYVRPSAQEERPAGRRSPEELREMRDAMRETRRQQVEQRRLLREQQGQSAAATQRNPAPASFNPSPPPPMPPAVGPANPPEVQYRNGLLSIRAFNSTLGEILNQVRAHTGAMIESPAGTHAERVAVQLGPAPVADVLGELLHGSRFDYIILGSQHQPGAVEQVILTQRGAPPTPGPVVHPREAYVEPDLDMEMTDEGMGDFVPDRGGDAVDDTTTAPGDTGQPGQPAAPGEQQIKTPEQLLRELQELQQQQLQQQQEQQHPQGPRPIQPLPEPEEEPQ